jgi:hypothetical protein
MTQPVPVEARCDHCQQTRPLFLYEPDHDFHVIPVSCEWCAREKQPLLCARCWGVEKRREENAPMSKTEEQAAAGFYALVENNSRLIARAEADLATCEAIAAATAEAESA